MECTCFTADIDGYVTMLSATRRKARKHHKCAECLGVIFPGQTYMDERYLFEGEVRTHKTCECCMSVRDHLFCQYTYGEIWSNLEDFIYDWMHYDLDGAPWARIARLTPTARAHVLLIIEEIWRDAIHDDDDDEVGE